MEQNTKKCPFCGEEIMADAKKCRHCGEWLDKTSSHRVEEISTKPKAKGNKKKAWIIAGAAVIIIAIVGVIIAFSTNKSECNDITNSPSTSVQEDVPELQVERQVADYLIRVVKDKKYPISSDASLVEIHNVSGIDWKSLGEANNQLIIYFENKAVIDHLNAILEGHSDVMFNNGPDEIKDALKRFNAKIESLQKENEGIVQFVNSLVPEKK